MPRRYGMRSDDERFEALERWTFQAMHTIPQMTTRNSRTTRAMLTSVLGLISPYQRTARNAAASVASTASCTINNFGLSSFAENRMASPTK